MSVVVQGAPFEVYVLGSSDYVNSTYALLEYSSSEDMIVDGTTPKDFVVNAHGTDDYKILELKLVMVANTIKFNNKALGKGGSALTNGILIDATINNGTSATVETLKQNEDFIRINVGSSQPFLDQNGSNSILASSIIFGGSMVLEGGTSDKVRVRIQDDLTDDDYGLKYLTATLYSVKIV